MHPSRTALGRALFLLVLALTLVACSTPAGQRPAPAEAPPTTVAAESPTSAPTDEPAVTAMPEPEPTPTDLPAPAATAAPPASELEDDGLPRAVLYDLGEAIITQAGFPEDSRFRNMPVRLNGVMAVPVGEGPYPVAVILHGTHPGCPLNEFSVDAWPCAIEDEQPNYQGFEYLVRELAARGYVALSLNINAENTFGFGEPVPFERLSQIVDLQLSALQEASAGGANDFGVALEGKADLGRLAFMGHSRGGEAAGELVQVMGLTDPAGVAERGYGPVAGVLMLAPAVVSTSRPSTTLPLAVILPGCDGDVVDQEGQWFYERVRLSEDNPSWATTLFLPGANHNNFNSILGGDMGGSMGRADCQPIMDGETQRAFAVAYTADFLETLFGDDPAAASAAASRLGLDVTTPTVSELYGLPATVSLLLPASDRLRLFVPASEVELATNLTGGTVTAEGLTLQFCEEGYFLPSIKPGTEACRRADVTVPGNPALIPVSWSAPGAVWRFALGEGSGDLSAYTAVSLRAALDPKSALNAIGELQALSVRLTDASGATATVATRPDEPALRFPVGTVQPSDMFEDGMFDGRVPLTTMRVPLADFEGVDLSAITEIALVFDQTPSGTLLLADLEAVRAPVE